MANSKNASTVPEGTNATVPEGSGAENTAAIISNSIEDNIARMNEPVTIQLFKDAGRYKHDIFVRVDGKRYQVKRGIPVQVPRKVADVINQQLRQDQATAQMIELKNAEYERKSSELK